MVVVHLCEIFSRSHNRNVSPVNVATLLKAEAGMISAAFARNSVAVRAYANVRFAIKITAPHVHRTHASVSSMGNVTDVISFMKDTTA